MDKDCTSLSFLLVYYKVNQYNPMENLMVKYRNIPVKNINKAKSYPQPVKLLVWNEGQRTLNDSDIKEVVVILDQNKARHPVVTSDGEQYDYAAGIPTLPKTKATYRQLASKFSGFELEAIVDTETNVFSTELKFNLNDLDKEVPDRYKLVKLAEMGKAGQPLKLYNITLATLDLLGEE